MPKHEKLHIKDLRHFSPKQEEARKTAFRHRYVLYGGAMAGGKSYWLRWMLVSLLIRWARGGHRNVEVGLFCENYPTLKDRQLSKIGSEFPGWLGTLHGDHATHGRCYILAEEYGGGIIKFRNLDDPSKYQSAEFAAIAVDELTKNARDVFDDLRNRLRWPGISDIHFIGATNPGGIGHAWVKKLWLDRIYDDGEQEEHEFAYVKALASDNPHIDKSYLKQLESLPPDKRRAYLEGDWDIFKGQYFTEWRREIHICKPFAIPDDWRRIISGDYGHFAPASVGWWALSPDGIAYRYRELYRTGLAYSQLAEEVSAMTPPNEKIDYEVWDPAIWSKKGENDQNLSGAEIYERRRKDTSGKAPRLVRGDNNRILGWAQMHEWLRPYLNQDGLLSSRLQVFATCEDFIRTLPALIHDEHKPEDVDSDGEDHAPDDARYFLMSRPRPTVTTEEVSKREFASMLKKKKSTQGRGGLLYPRP